MRDNLYGVVQVASHDPGPPVWQAKRKYDAVRPFSAIKYLYGDKPVTAWGGPMKGTITNLPADQWRSYIPVADHPEYPSASACLCATVAQAMRCYLGSDELGWKFPIPAGTSRIEPGLPPSNFTLEYPTWSTHEKECGQSRVWAGVHFQSAVDASLKVCGKLGQQVCDWFLPYLNGDAPLRAPAVARPLSYADGVPKGADPVPFPTVP
jgi:hypothetical protein